MANDLRIKIKVDKDTGQLLVTQKEFNKLGKSITTTKGAVNGFSNSIKNLAIGVSSVYLITKAFSTLKNTIISFTETSIEFERFETILTTLEGSSAKAEASMSWITDFTKSTPYQLAQVTDGFVKLKAYGIDPTDGTLRTLGDTASAMGKDLNQAVEAMADAVVGENERLKEFGVKAKVQGEEIAYSWTSASGEAKNIVIKNNAEIIQSTLSAIFNSKYEGAMEAQSRTMAGMMSNISDNWTLLKKSIMDNGLFNYFKSITSVISDLFKASFKDMAEAGQTGASLVISSFEGIIKAVAQVIDAFDIFRSGLMFLQNIGAFVYKAELYIKRFATNISNYLVEANNTIASSAIGQFLGFNTTRSKSLFDETKFKAQIDGINSYITTNALKIGELIDRDMSATTDGIVAKINAEFNKLQNSTKEISAPKTDFGNSGTFEGFNSDSSSSTSTKSVLDEQSDMWKLYSKDRLDTLEDEAKESNSIWEDMGKNFTNTFGTKFADTLLSGQASFSDFANSILEDMARMAIQSAMSPITSSLTSGVGSFFSGLFNANGNAFVNGQVQAFASGGIVSSPTFFNHSGGVGVAGEAGSELIAPMRMGNGEMGVQSKASKVVLNITNNSGNEISAEQVSEMTQTNANGESERVISIVMDGVSRNKNGIRDMLKGVK